MRRERQGRITFLFLCMAILFVVVAARLAYLQVIARGDLARKADRQQEQQVRFEAKRGTIYDRRGRELAVSLDVESVYGVPTEVDNPRAAATRLARVLSEDPAALRRKLTSDRQFVWISRKVGPAKAAQAKKVDPDAIGFRMEPRRFYPKKTLAGSVLGFTNVDGEGIEGLELRYDGDLKGSDGWFVAARDARGRVVFPEGDGLEFRLPRAGKDLFLTIDAVVQHIAEKELDRALKETRSQGGVVIVLEPRTGAVLAMAARSPKAFNPNDPRRNHPEEWRNRAVTDVFEPGSIFKAVLAAAALEERVVTPKDKIDCSAGSIKVADRVIRDAHKIGVITFADVIAVSSNVGTIKVAQRLGKARFHRYISAFGFGAKTGIDLPGEIPGLLKDHLLWSGVSLATIAIGQEIGVTPIQMAAAYGAIANGGVLMQPFVVAEVRGRKDDDGWKREPDHAGRVVSEETTLTLQAMLRKVVESGTGKKAKPSGYTAAGKTGTAQKIDRSTGTYSKDEYISSFAGFAPATDPKLVILVMMDSPVGVVYGGTVAAPVFKAIAEQGLAYLQVPPDDVGGRMLLVAR